MTTRLGRWEQAVLDVMRGANNAVTVIDIAWSIHNRDRAANPQGYEQPTRITVAAVNRAVHSLEQRGLLYSEANNGRKQTIAPTNAFCSPPTHRTSHAMEISEQTVEILVMTALFHYGGKASWRTVCLATQKMMNEIMPSTAQTGAPSSTIDRVLKRLQAMGKVEIEEVDGQSAPTDERQITLLEV